jgi:hypothetical protein
MDSCNLKIKLKMIVQMDAAARAAVTALQNKETESSNIITTSMPLIG